MNAHRSRWTPSCSLALTLVLFCDSALAGNAAPPERTKDYVIELGETTYRFENDGTGEVIQQARISVLSPMGREQVAQVPLPYLSGPEDLRIDYVRTVKKDGTRIDADPASATEIAPPLTDGAPVFSDARVKVLVASKLEVGDQLEYRAARVRKAPVKRGDFWTVHYPRRWPAPQIERVVLDVPEGRKLTFKVDPDAPPYTLVKDKQRIRYIWELRTPPSEDEATLRRLFIVSTLKGWDEVARWYSGLQAESAQITPELEQLAASLTQGKSGPAEKVEAIYQYVAQKVRYVALEFGLSGYQAHPASHVLKNGYGDCKDKAQLMIALLAAVRVTAFPALASTRREPLETAVAMPAQFDHVLVAVPLDGHLHWADPSLQLAAFGQLAPALRGKPALLIDPARPRLETIPRSALADQEKLAAKGKLEASGDLQLDNVFELKGDIELGFRQLFHLTDNDAKRRWYEAFAEQQASGAHVDDPKNSDPTDLHSPFTFSFHVLRSRFFGLLEQAIVSRVPLGLIPEHPWETQLARFETKDAASKKKASANPLQLEYGLVEVTLDLELDPVYRVEIPPDAHIDTSFAAYNARYRFENGHLKVRRALDVKSSELESSRWSELAALKKAIESDLSTKLVLRRTVAVDVRSHLGELSADELNRVGIKALEQTKDYALARDALLKATEKDPQHKNAWNNLGRAYTRLEDFEEAERALKKAIELNPKDSYAYNNLGIVYQMTNRHEAAIAEFKKQLEINPLDSFAVPNLAESYARLQRWQEAADAWRNALAIKPDDPGTEIHLARALINTGKTEEANRLLDHALDKDRSPYLANAAAWSLVEGGVELDRAERLAKYSVERIAAALKNVTLRSQLYGHTGAFSGSLDTLGWVYFKKGQLKEAGEYLEAAYTFSPSPTISEHMALFRLKQDDAQGARRIYGCLKQTRGVAISATLEEALVQKFGSKKKLDSGPEPGVEDCGPAKKLDQSSEALFNRGSEHAPSTAPTSVSVAALVGENGKVEEAELLRGEESLRAEVLAVVKGLDLPLARWPGGPLRTLRTILVHYSRDGKAHVRWAYGKVIDRTTVTKRADAVDRHAE